jgi:hypothetical protein
MRHSGAWKYLYWAIFGISWFAWFMSAALAPSLKANPDEIRKWWTLGADVVATCQHYAWIAIPLFIGTHSIGKVLYHRIGSSKKWQSAQSLLDEFQRHIFEKEKDSALHHHRVTLYKYCGWLPCWEKWPWTGWLKPVLRSGYTTQKSKVRFRAPDKADLVEGIAGQTWARNEILIIDDLPDVDGHDVDDIVREYARKTWMPDKWLSDWKKKPQARSFCGIPVEVNRKIWGVIVIDSRAPKSIER